MRRPTRCHRALEPTLVGQPAAARDRVLADVRRERADAIGARASVRRRGDDDDVLVVARRKYRRLSQLVAWRSSKRLRAARARGAELRRSSVRPSSPTLGSRRRGELIAAAATRQVRRAPPLPRARLARAAPSRAAAGDDGARPLRAAPALLTRVRGDDDATTRCSRRARRARRRCARLGARRRPAPTARATNSTAMRARSANDARARASGASGPRPGAAARLDGARRRQRARRPASARAPPPRGRGRARACVVITSAHGKRGRGVASSPARSSARAAARSRSLPEAARAGELTRRTAEFDARTL